MDDNIIECQECWDLFCAKCFELTDCDVCRRIICEDCYNKKIPCGCKKE